ncbi:MAG: Conserved putative rane protein, partial [Ilumatobacteraceae bacterium]|nr:Conserved putative rane protein [Ilumatobacteraceae bacterium]
MQHGTFKSALSQPTFRLALAAYSLVSASLGIGAVVVSVSLFQRGGSPAWATVGAITRVVPFILLSGISGNIADRHDHRIVLRNAYVAQLLVAIMLVFTAGHAPLLLIALLGLAAQSAWTIAYPTMAALVPRVVEADDLAAANGLLSSVESLAWIAGPGIGGLLISAVGFGTTALVQAVLTLVGIGLAALLVQRHDIAGPDEAPAYETPTHEGLLTSLRGAFLTLVQTSAVVVPLSLLFVSNVVYGAMQVLLLVAATDRLHMSQGGYGALTAGLGAGAFGALFVINRAARSRRPTTMLAASVIIAGAPVAVIAVVDVPAIVVVLLFVSGLGLVLTEVLALTAMQRNVPPEKVALVFGVIDSMMVTAILLGTAMASPLIHEIGIEKSLVLLGGLVPVVAAFAAPRLARGREAAATKLAALSPTIELLAGLPVLRHASRAAVEAIAADSTRRVVSAGEVIIAQGDEADHFYAIVDGEIDVFIRHTDGEIEHIRTMGPGAGFGELGLLHRTPRTATVTALTDATLVRVPGESFMRA